MEPMKLNNGTCIPLPRRTARTSAVRVVDILEKIGYKIRAAYAGPDNVRNNSKNDAHIQLYHFDGSKEYRVWDCSVDSYDECISFEDFVAHFDRPYNVTIFDTNAQKDNDIIPLNLID